MAATGSSTFNFKTMKLFLIKLAIFLGLAGVMLGIAEAGLSHVASSYILKKQSLEKQLQKIEILNLGSSHADSAINPDFFSRPGMNMANYSQSLYYDMKILDKYLDSMPHLKLVFLPASYFSLGFQLSDCDEKWRCFFYERVYGIPLENPAIRWDIRRFSYLMLYGVDYIFSHLGKGFRNTLAKEFNASGSRAPQEKLLRQHINEEEGKTRAELSESLFKESLLAENQRFLETMIQRLQTRNIRAVLLTTPAYKTYSAHLSSKLLETHSRIMTQLTQKYGISYFDFFTDSRFQLEDFEDNDHLNAAGAKKFSQLLDQEIIKKLVDSSK